MSLRSSGITRPCLKKKIFFLLETHWIIYFIWSYMLQGWDIKKKKICLFICPSIHPSVCWNSTMWLLFWRSEWKPWGESLSHVSTSFGPLPLKVLASISSILEDLRGRSLPSHKNSRLHVYKRGWPGSFQTELIHIASTLRKKLEERSLEATLWIF